MHVQNVSWTTNCASWLKFSGFPCIELSSQHLVSAEDWSKSHRSVRQNFLDFSSKIPVQRPYICYHCIVCVKRASKRAISHTLYRFNLRVDIWGSLVPRPCAFVACSTKFAQRAWARSSRDVCHSLRHGHFTENQWCHRIASAAFHVERGSQRSQ